MPDRTRDLVGAMIKIQWPWGLIVRKVLYTYEFGKKTFHGIVAREAPFSAIDREPLLWVLDGENGLTEYWEVGPEPQRVGTSLEWDVERVIGHYRTREGQFIYSIKWVGYDCPTWEPEDHLGNCNEAVLRYWLDAASQHGVQYVGT